jgi:hypothetical protein
MQSSFEHIVEAFNSRTLEKSLWTHEAHQIVAIWYLMNFEPNDALCRIRSGIIAYNLATGGENTGQNGYHETVTVFWWTLIGLYIRDRHDMSFEDMCESFLLSRYTQRNIGFEFYTRELLLSPAARSKYFEPDIKEVAL